MRAFSEEQADRLRDKVVAAGHLHGDESEVILEGVGVVADPGGVRLAFCPTTVHRHKVTCAASVPSRLEQVPAEVEFDSAAQQTLLDSVPERFRGFATMRAMIHSNGRVNVFGVKVISLETVHPDVHVNRQDSYRLFKDAHIVS